MAYVDDSISVLSESIVLFSAKMNSGGLSATYFIEYGTAQYSLNMTTKEKSIHLDTVFINVADTIWNLLMSTNYYYRIHLMNSKDTIIGEIKSFLIPLIDSNKTILYHWYTINPTFTGVTFKATVISPINVAISFAYGNDPYSVSVYTANPGKVDTLSATVKDLIPNSTYRWRLDINGGNMNNYHTADSQFTTSTDLINAKEFIYPLSIGNSWKYRYYYESHISGMNNPPYTSGIHIWNIVGTHISNDSIIYEMECIYQDTVRSSTDTTVVNKMIPFSIAQSQYGTRINWTFPVSVYSEAYRIPRFVLVDTDAITRNFYGGFVKYANNIGLFEFSYVSRTNYSTVQKLSLISFSKN